MVKFLASIIPAYLIGGLVFFGALKINSQIPYSNSYSPLLGWIVMLIWPLLMVKIYRILANKIVNKKPNLAMKFSMFMYISSFALFIASSVLIFIIEVYYFNEKDFHLNEPFYFYIFQAINVALISVYFYLVDFKRIYLKRN